MKSQIVLKIIMICLLVIAGVFVMVGLSQFDRSAMVAERTLEMEYQAPLDGIEMIYYMNISTRSAVLGIGWLFLAYLSISIARMVWSQYQHRELLDTVRK